MQVTRAHKALTTNGLRGTLKQKHTQVVLDDSALLGSSCSIGIAQAILGYISCLGSPQVSWGHTPLTHLGTTPSSFSLSHLALNPSNSLGTYLTQGKHPSAILPPQTTETPSLPHGKIDNTQLSCAPIQQNHRNKNFQITTENSTSQSKHIAYKSHQSTSVVWPMPLSLSS